MLNPPPSKKFRKRLEKKFSVAGTIADLPRSGRPRSARTEANIFTTALFFSERFHETSVDLSSHKPSLNDAADFINVSATSVHRILKQDVKWRSLLPHRAQFLSWEHVQAREEFAGFMLGKLHREPFILDMILWTDEALFKLNGQVRTNLIRYWGDDSVKKIYQKRNIRTSVMVSLGVWRYGIIGPFFFDDLPKAPSEKKKNTVDHNKFLLMMKNCYMPEINSQFPMWDPDVKKNFWFMLDGASIHTAKPVRKFLNETFPRRWIGNNGCIKWPANSPDLTPLGIFYFSSFIWVYSAISFMNFGVTFWLII